MEFDYLQDQIAGFVKDTPLNKIEEVNLKRIYDSPLVGIADASDPLFDRLKEPGVIGPHHLSPREWLPEAKTVVSYFLPFCKEILLASRKDNLLPVQEWVLGRFHGEILNRALRNFIVELAKKNRVKAIAPVLNDRYMVIKKRSNWSERHIAYIAGLGTFGLNKSLITKKGIAGRIGSVVISAPLEASIRLYDGLFDYCNMCRECISRCLSGAITEKGKDIFTCSNYIDIQVRGRFGQNYSCGKCQVGIQCENKIPEKQ